MPSKESNLIDPFSLRVGARKREEIAASAAAAAARPAATKPVENLELQGIWYDSEMKVAFISDQAVSVGGTISGWKLVSLSREQAVLTKGSATKILRLGGK
ncbi:MAG: hypothetical protein JW873_02500 [Candidatus Saganbacteria bacterium]|nr:hypothetical protein [Candidatus Saganbacteria bacterium]